MIRGKGGGGCAKLRKYLCVAHSDCTHCMPFFDKKSAKMSIFTCENRKNSLAAGGFTPRPPVMGSTLPNPRCATEQKEWIQPITGKASN